MTTDSAQPTIFSYRTPEVDRGKRVVQLAHSDILKGSIQVLVAGGENNLHSHSGNDGFWLVLSGRIKFYGEDDVLLADLSKHDGILIPRGCKYWFESASDEPAEILHVAALAQNVRDQRTDHMPRRQGAAAVEAS